MVIEREPQRTSEVQFDQKLSIALSLTKEVSRVSELAKIQTSNNATFNLFFSSSFKVNTDPFETSAIGQKEHLISCNCTNNICLLSFPYFQCKSTEKKEIRIEHHGFGIGQSKEINRRAMAFS